MNVLICDGLKHDSEKLAGLLAESGYEISVKIFDRANDVLRFIRSGKMIDVCFFDILIPDMTGVELAAHLREIGFTGQIVFLSALREYGPEAVSVKAISYLIKPPTKESIDKALCEIDKVLKDGDTGGILVKSVGISRCVLFRDISYIEVIRNSVFFRMRNGTELETRTTFSKVAAQLLSDRRFAQCHRSYIVNMRDISAYTDKEIIMRSGAVIPISRSFAEVRIKLPDWIFMDS